MELPTFTAKTVTGAKRGRALGTPTINLDLNDVPADLRDGIYACRATIDERTFDAVMHHGPRPVFKDTPSCEVHVLDTRIDSLPSSVTVDIVAFLREVRDFPSPHALMEQIQEDIEDAKAVLGK